MTYYSKKLKKNISAKEILNYCDQHNVNYVKARCELRIEEVPTPKESKPHRRYKSFISRKDLACLAYFGITQLGLKIN